jgi:hypothetical protein
VSKAEAAHANARRKKDSVGEKNVDQGAAETMIRDPNAPGESLRASVLEN